MKQSFRLSGVTADPRHLRLALALARAALIGGTCLATLTACGQRGPLYLPGPVAPAKAGAQAAPTGTAGDLANQPRLPAKADGGVKNAPSNDSNFTTPTN